MNVMFQEQDLVPSSSERNVNHLLSCILQKGLPQTLATLRHEYTVSKILKSLFTFEYEIQDKVHKSGNLRNNTPTSKTSKKILQSYLYACGKIP